MRRLIIIGLLMLVVPGLALAQAPVKNTAATQAMSVADQIVALEQEWVKAERDYDVAWFEQHLADSFQGIGPDGQMGNKAGFLTGVKARSLKTDSFTISDLNVQGFGDTAVITGMAHMVNPTVGGKPYPSKTRWTDVWVQRAGQWQCVASHASEVK